MKQNRPFKGKRKWHSCGMCKPHKRGMEPARTAKDRSEARAALREVAEASASSPHQRNGP